MTQDYSELLLSLDRRASVARSEDTGTALGDALHFEQAATAIRALVEENERLREALKRIGAIDLGSLSIDQCAAIRSVMNDGDSILAKYRSLK